MNNNIKKIEPELEEIIKYLQQNSYKLTEEPTEKSAKLSQVIMVDPIEDKVSVTRVTITPNPNYEAYMQDAHEYPVEDRHRASKYNVDTKYMALSSNSKEFTEVERKILEESKAYAVFKKYSEQNNQPEA